MPLGPWAASQRGKRMVDLGFASCQKPWMVLWEHAGWSVPAPQDNSKLLWNTRGCALEVTERRIMRMVEFQVNDLFSFRIITWRVEKDTSHLVVASTFPFITSFSFLLSFHPHLCMCSLSNLLTSIIVKYEGRGDQFCYVDICIFYRSLGNWRPMI